MYSIHTQILGASTKPSSGTWDKKGVWDQNMNILGHQEGIGSIWGQSKISNDPDSLFHLYIEVQKKTGLEVLNNLLFIKVATLSSTREEQSSCKNYVHMRTRRLLHTAEETNSSIHRLILVQNIFLQFSYVLVLDTILNSVSECLLPRKKREEKRGGSRRGYLV